jgi:hypothetical protein
MIVHLKILIHQVKKYLIINISHSNDLHIYLYLILVKEIKQRKKPSFFHRWFICCGGPSDVVYVDSSYILSYYIIYYYYYLDYYLNYYLIIIIKEIKMIVIVIDPIVIPQ